MSDKINNLKNNIIEYFENVIKKYKNKGRQIVELFHDTNKNTKNKLIELFYNDDSSSFLKIIRYVTWFIAIYLSFKCNEDNSLNFLGLIAALCCPECYIIYIYYITNGEMCGMFDFYTGKETKPPYTIAGKALYTLTHPEEAIKKITKKKLRIKIKNTNK